MISWLYSFYYQTPPEQKELQEIIPRPELQDITPKSEIQDIKSQTQIQHNVTAKNVRTNKHHRKKHKKQQVTEKEIPLHIAILDGSESKTKLWFPKHKPTPPTKFHSSLTKNVHQPKCKVSRRRNT